MKHIIAGTAGHIDHGKTSLVRALTGIDTDRLEEEKRRGISIDLGFAHLDLGADLRVGFIDVPGHERFVKNMLAGVGGIDLVMLVISAEESIKPQTREHFQICRLLQIPRGLVALTKADLTDPDLLGLVQLEVEEFVAGSFLEGAPIVPVSAVTGQGIPELREALRRVALSVVGHDAAKPARLPIDRAFSMRGFGTVVTGTLTAGVLRTEQEVEVQPGGAKLRIRGLQVHGAATTIARAGQRTAVNLAGAEPSELPRGLVLTVPGMFRAARQIDCLLELLPDAKPLRENAPVHFHTGSAEVEGEVRGLQGDLKPGKTTYARIKLSQPVMLLPGDRFIIRQFSPVVTIGGGTVLDIAPPRARRELTLARLDVLARGNLSETIALLVRESRYGLGWSELTRRTGIAPEALQKAVSPHVQVLAGPPPWLVNPEWVRGLIEKWRAELQAFHKANPLLPGLPKEELRSRTLAGAPPFLIDALLRQAKLLTVEGEMVRLAAHKLALRQDEEQAVQKIEALFAQGGLAVPSVNDVLAQSGVEAARGRSLLQILLRDRRLVRVNEELVYHPEAMQKLRALLGAHKGERFGVGDFKDWTGISRKYAIPLLEYLDRERVTRRDGENRLVL